MKEHPRHSVHVMLVHFPVGLWPAHECLHLFSSKLPAGAAAVVGFWLLAAGTALGWLAAIFGVVDLVGLRQKQDDQPLSLALIHGALNGAVLSGSSAILALEYGAFPVVSHGTGFLAGEAALLGVTFLGNHFGGAVIWRRPGR